MPQKSAIDVCICTFRRASLSVTLESIREQTGWLGPVRIIVADNDDTPSALPLVEAARQTGLIIHYVHAPARNISIARNACLAATEAPLVAFIDDDEVAHTTWLDELVAALNADPRLVAVFGPVRALYPEHAPAWARKADLHSTEPVITPAGVDTGYTSNAMVRANALAGQRFDEALGRSGGEDTDLFTRLHKQGARYGVAPKAIVFEAVASDRLNTRWLATRAFRSGQTHARRFLAGINTRTRAFAVAAAKCLYCMALTLLYAGSPSQWRRAWVRASLHAGAAARLCGFREGRLYG
ncbi:glycosyltransferase family 2 protein [Brevundimonas variabilis]|uniref:glycosyltransferase family 2 protein n=1 Tax=Brevundimonas variabilis TaxID=74312 RepID=UPI001C856A38|nr:glycosyltransferase family 2 protein [Brevundimonas variabilis]